MNTQRKDDAQNTPLRAGMYRSMGQPAGWKPLNRRRDTFDEVMFALSWIFGILAAFCFGSVAVYHLVFR